jgi:hypothetical protein
MILRKRCQTASGEGNIMEERPPWEAAKAQIPKIKRATESPISLFWRDFFISLSKAFQRLF